MKEMKGAKKVGESRRRRRRRRPQGRFIEICCRWWEFPTSLIAAVMRGHLRILAGSVETHSFGVHVILSFIILRLQSVHVRLCIDRVPAGFASK